MRRFGLVRVPRETQFLICEGAQDSARVSRFCRRLGAIALARWKRYSLIRGGIHVPPVPVFAMSSIRAISHPGARGCWSSLVIGESRTEEGHWVQKSEGGLKVQDTRKMVQEEIVGRTAAKRSSGNWSTCRNGAPLSPAYHKIKRSANAAA